jgi:adenylosuccinate synthase
MVIDPEALFNELAMLTEREISWEGRVHISDRAHLVLPSHKSKDIEIDKKRKRPIGTTGRGIGVTYSLKSSRDGMRIGDMWDENMLSTLDNEDRIFVEKHREKIKPMILNLAMFMYKQKGSFTLFEGAQGALLDIDIGTYPYVSSGNSAASGASVGGGIGPRDIDRVLGVFKAYSTRVGNGPFPSEFTAERDGELEAKVRELGREYGVTTGRPRRCGYLDLVALKYACMTNSIDSLVLTHIDVYDSMDEIKVCTGYDYSGEILQHFPTSTEVLSQCKPSVRSFKGWKKGIGGCKDFAELPEETKEYIGFIEEYTKTPIDIISVGYERKQTIVRKEIWKKSSY